VLILVYTFLYELGIYMAQVQLIVEVDKEFKEKLIALAKEEDRTLKAFVTRALKDAAIAKSGSGVAA
jgi:predicted transcriptional regulator